MGTENKSNLPKKIISNIYVKNIFLMILAVIALICLILLSLKIYTRHNETVQVPDLKGLQVQDARPLVSSASLKCEIVDSLYHKDGIPGAILEQIPAGGSKVKEGRTIYLTIQNLAVPMVAVPDLEDASLRQSNTLLSTLGFTDITVVYIPSEYQDLVYAVEYKGVKLKAGQKIPQGSPLTLKVGDGNKSFIDDVPIDSSANETY